MPDTSGCRTGKGVMYVEFEIPLLTLSGGLLESLDDALEFRLWLHPHGGSDRIVRSWTLRPLLRAQQEHDESGDWSLVEKPLAVVWDRVAHNFREVVIPDSLLAAADEEIRCANCGTLLADTGAKDEDEDRYCDNCLSQED